MEVLIADDDFADGVSFYDFDKAQLKQVQKCVAEFNKKGYKDERERLSAYTKEENAKAITQKDDGVSYITGYKVTVQADIVGNRIMIDSMDYKTQKAFEEICERQGVNLDVTIPAKLASLLDNIKFEMANKRGKNSDGTTSSLVKQIIFCDHLFLHNKIVRLLAKHTGIAKDKIAIITGQVNSEADEIIDIQNGFNEMGEDNRYQIIIANKKAEIGINLQKGTQAIHHLTTGWTPDSLEQRNGRGARQGNHTESVRIYYYDADGTFDSLKRNMVNKKDEWIGELLQGNSQSVAVAGDLTDKDKDALINAIGDESAIQTYLKQKEQAETEARIKEATARQIVGLQTIKNNSEMLRCGFIHDVYAKLNTWASVSADLAKTKAIYRDGGEYTGKFVFEIRDDKQQTAYNRFKQATQDILDMLSDNIKNGSDIDSITKAIIDDNLSTIGAKGGWGLGAKNNESGYLFVFSRFALKQGVSLTGQGVVDTNWANLQSDDYIKFTKKQEMGKKLISQAMIAVDDIATNENGKIPVGAGQLVLDNKALLHGDTLYQTGDLVIYHNGENNHVGVVSEYNSLGNRISIYYNSPNGYSHEYIYKNPIEAWHERIDNISQIAKTDSRYLEIVKQLAEFDNKKLRENKETVFSKYNADVLEYVNNN